MLVLPYEFIKQIEYQTVHKSETDGCNVITEIALENYPGTLEKLISETQYATPVNKIRNNDTVITALIKYMCTPKKNNEKPQQNAGPSNQTNRNKNQQHKSARKIRGNQYGGRKHQ